MATRRERILRLLEHSSGLTDREITDQLEGHSALQQPINQLCHRMAAQKIIERKIRNDGLIGNYLVGKEPNEKTGMNSKGSIKTETISRGANHENKTLVKAEALRKLISLGFDYAGHWFLDVNEVNFELTKFSDERDILYVFVEKDEIKYIGKSIQNLHKRMYLYKKCGESQRTNIRVRELIRLSLKNGSQIQIYAFIQRTPMMYQDIPISLAAGLEDNLIKLFNPDWNILKNL